MKLTDEQRSDVMTEVLDYADARAGGWTQAASAALDALLRVVERLMTEAYEAGKAERDVP